MHWWLLLHFVVGILAQGSTYKRDPRVYELTSKNFDQVVHGLNYTTVVEFYAPWCGYCQKLHPSYSKLGKFIHEDAQFAANVAAVNCDADINKQLCADYRIQGFPSLLVFRPPKYDGKDNKGKRHISEPYQGERSFKAILDFLTSRLKNYVKKFKLGGELLPKWLAELDKSPRVLLVSENTQISPLLKLVAIDFLGSVEVGLVPTKKEVSELQVGDDSVSINKASLPMLVYYDTSSGQFVKYPGKKVTNKEKITAWITKVTGVEPNEGALLKLGKKLYKIRTGKKKVEVVDDEL